jgi:DNA modification methylase/ParB-like chromosome segregation protein Spo0J
MLIVPLASVIVGERQRSKIEPGPLAELREAIVATGLLHPPVVTPIVTDTRVRYDLVVGERRFRAIFQLAAEGKSFWCSDQLISPGSIPVSLLSDFLDESGQFLAELNENIIRVDLHWSDRARALAKYHSLCSDKAAIEGARSGTEATAQRLLTEHPTLQGAATLDNTVHRLGIQIKEAVVVAAHLNDTKIAGARNLNEAYTAVLKRQEDIFRAEIARRNLVSRPTIPSIRLEKGELENILPQLEAGIADLIMADPPYGIDAGSGGFRSRTIHHHDYNDSVEYARSVARTILVEGFRICKNRANLFMFCDIRQWGALSDLAASMGWSPFPRPGVWVKSDSEGLAPWGSTGFRITTEYFLYATKGARGLIASPVDVFRVNRVARHEREHAAEKPTELLQRLIECSTLPGEFVLDPCCGSGSSLVAAKLLKRTGLGIEKDPDYHTIAFKNIFGDAA